MIISTGLKQGAFSSNTLWVVLQLLQLFERHDYDAMKSIDLAVNGYYGNYVGRAVPRESLGLYCFESFSVECVFFSFAGKY